MDLIKHSQLLPEKPTAADTADWYRLGDSVEKHGRHMKRQAVAAEYNSGREMKAWFALIEQPEQTMRSLLQEAHNLGLTSVATLPDGEQLSQSMPTQKAAREYAKAEPEVREVIKEQITLNGKTYTAAEIKALNNNLATEAMEGRIAMNDRDKLREQLNALTEDNGSKDLEEARKEIDALYTSILTVSRNINNLSTKVFTHNDTQYITKIQKALEGIISDFTDKAEQVIAFSSEPSSGYSSGTTGSEVRIIDVTHTN
jgi:hypothetical protein